MSTPAYVRYSTLERARARARAPLQRKKLCLVEKDFSALDASLLCIRSASAAAHL